MIKVIPYDYKVAKFKDYYSEGFWVKLYCFFDGEHVYCFPHEHDALDNIQLCHECGVDTDIFTRTVLVTPRRFAHIFNEIRDYENVSRSDSD